MSWPDPPAGGPLGDGRSAHATDRPATIEDLRQVVSERVGQGHAIYPQGGATALDHGGPPATPGVAVDLRRLDRVVDYPHADMTITVEAGITLDTLNAHLSGHGQRLLIDAPQPDRATLGGIFATATCGPRRFGLGRPRDQVLGVGFVDAEGRLVRGGGRVVKNVAGYDLPRLLTGSMGTLGIIVELTLKVRPKPESSVLAWSVVPDAARIEDLLDRLNVSGTRPVAVELLNAPAAVRNAGDTGLPASGWVLVVGFEDNAASVAWQVDRWRTEFAGEVETLEGEAAASLWSRLNEFQAEALGPLTVAASVRPSAVASFVETIDPGRWAVQSHVGNGIVRAHALGRPALDEVALEVDRLRGLALDGGGNLVLTRCPTDWKPRLKVWGGPRPDWSVCERIKDTLDPRRVFNPGRFVGKI